MAGETPITVVGNLTADPELRYTQSGTAVASFTVASTPRRFNKQTNQWEDGEALFLRCNLWREPAENLANSNIVRGTRVVVTGSLTQRTYDTQNGEKRTVIELRVDEVAPSVRHATVQVNRVQRSQGGGQQQNQQGGGQYQGQQQGGYVNQGQQQGYQGGQQQGGQQMGQQQGMWDQGGLPDEPPF